MPNIPVSKVRENFAEIIEAAQTEPVILERHGKELAVLLSIEQFQAMQKVYEQDGDIAAANEILLRQIERLTSRGFVQK